MGVGSDLLGLWEFNSIPKGYVVFCVRTSPPRPRTTSSTSWHLSRSPSWPTTNTLACWSRPVAEFTASKRNCWVTNFRTLSSTSWGGKYLMILWCFFSFLNNFYRKWLAACLPTNAPWILWNSLLARARGFLAIDNTWFGAIERTGRLVFEHSVPWACCSMLVQVIEVSRLSA